jgi:hypothetical protein
MINVRPKAEVDEGDTIKIQIDLLNATTPDSNRVRTLHLRSNRRAQLPDLHQTLWIGHHHLLDPP